MPWCFCTKRTKEEVERDRARGIDSGFIIWPSDARPRIFISVLIRNLSWFDCEMLPHRFFLCLNIWSSAGGTI